MRLHISYPFKLLFLYKVSKKLLSAEFSRYNLDGQANQQLLDTEYIKKSRLGSLRNFRQSL